MSTVTEGWEHWSEAPACKVQTRDQQTLLLLSTIREEGAENSRGHRQSPSNQTQTDPEKQAPEVGLREMMRSIKS